LTDFLTVKPLCHLFSCSAALVINLALFLT
jgi:hypothetical protein